jgi:predicted HTH transcriptional regulator
VEITSPGKLPNTLTEESIKGGIHRERNPIILSFLEKDKKFRYSGMGRGIPRVIKLCKETGTGIDFINNIEHNEFVVTFFRKVRSE